MFYCYIIYSSNLDKFYIGETEDLDERLLLHNTGAFKGSYTSKSSDWVVYHFIECDSRTQARLIETHIKHMKSRKYIENLSKYPEISEKLKKKYN